MIFFPKNWKTIGQPIHTSHIEQRLLQVIEELDCRNLSLSGGLDSSLLLWFMVQVYGNKDVRCFTIAHREDHPDYRYSNMIGRHLGVDVEIYCPRRPHAYTKYELDPDSIVREFYKNLIRRGVRRIIAGDGIDEFMCGYYGHILEPTEQTYYQYLSELNDKHLKPLNQNSSIVNVYLPYLDEKLITMLSQIPLHEKADGNAGDRKKIMVKMARGKIPNEIIERRKYGFCDAMWIKPG